MSSTRRTKKKLGMEKETNKEMPKSLPEEMILEILVRLPVQSLIRFKCVSKSWRSLISSSDFAKSHSQMCAPPRERVLLILNSSLHTLNYHNSTKSIRAELYPPQFTPEFLGSCKFVRVLGSCNGLVCILCDFGFAISDSDDDSDFVGDVIDEYVILYNPSTGQYRSIALPTPPSVPGEMECLGFGFVSGVQEYRVVRQVWDPLRSGNFQAQVLHLLGTDEATVGLEISCDYLVGNGKIGVFLNGSIHWLARSGASIIRLDLAREVFDEMPLPYHESGWYHSLGTLDGCLSFLHYKNAATCDVWAMKVYGIKISWTMLITIPHYFGQFMEPLMFVSDTKIMLAIRPRRTQIVIFDSVERSLEPITNFNSPGFCKLTTYIESLVSP